MENQKKNFAPAIVILGIALIEMSLPVKAWADAYKYIDDKGTTVFTDDLGTVQEKYRSKVEIIKEQKVQVVAAPPGKKENASEKKEPAASLSKTADTLPDSGSFADSEKILIIATAATVIFAAALIFVLNRYIRNRMAARLIFFLTMAVAGVFLYKMYAENMYRQFSDAKKSTENVKKLLDQKQGKQIKETGERGE